MQLENVDSSDNQNLKFLNKFKAKKKSRNPIDPAMNFFNIPCYAYGTE